MDEMAEGLDPEALVPAEAGEDQEETTPETQAELQPPAVQPKEWTRSQGGEVVENPEPRSEVTPAMSGEWWHSSALTGSGGGMRAPIPPPSGERFQRWRERRWVEDEDGGEWSYSTGPGPFTMDILRERFGEASFRDAPSWQPWATGVEPASTWQGVSRPASVDTHFHLASPKLRLEPVLTRQKRAAPPSAGTHSLSLGVGLGVRQDGWGGWTVPAQGVWDGGQTSTGQQADPQGSRGTHTTALGLPGAVPAWALGAGEPQPMWGPPPLQATFDGSSDRVAIFLSQVISYLDLYSHFYPSQ